MSPRPDNGLGEEGLLLDPDSGLEDAREQVGAAGAGVVAGDPVGEAGALGVGERAAPGSIGVEGGRVHRDRLDRTQDAGLEAAQDQHAGSIEVAAVGDGHAGAADHSQELDDGPAGLAARADHELVAAGAARLDVVQKRRLVFDDEGAPDRQLDDAGAAQLGQREGRDVAEGGVGGDVVEALPALLVHQRTKAVGGEGALVAVDSADLERQAARLAVGDVTGDLRGFEGGPVVLEQRGGDAAQAIGAGGERLAVAEHRGGEVGDSDRGVVGDGGVDAAGDSLALACGGAGAAAISERVGLGARAQLGVEEGAGGVGLDGAADVGHAALDGGAEGGGVGGGIAGRAVERGVNQVVDAGAVLLAADAVRAADVEDDLAIAAVADRARREELDEGAGLFGAGLDGDAAGERAVALAPVEDLAEDRGEPGRLPAQAPHVIDDSGHGEHRSRARRLIGRDREAAFDDGCAPALLGALTANVGAALAAERAPYYINVLYALVLMRRGHELEPRHDDLYARVARPQQLLGAYDPVQFATDLDQLIGWRVIERITEAQRLRGYKDNRLVQYRYRIGDDASAAIEWLEARLARVLEGRIRDSRDLLADVIGALKEARRVLDSWRKGARDPDSARRAYYLMESAAGAVGAISEELLAFRAEMVLFAHQPYDIGALREIIGWLQRYVDVYLRRVLELRDEIRDRARELSAPRYRNALAACRESVEHERRVPGFARQAGPLRDEAALLDVVHRFFRHDGQLASLCRHIDESARQVVLKMHHHVRELERRSARLDDLRAAISALAGAPEATDDRYGAYINYVIASGRGMFDGRHGTIGNRVAPPAPRKHKLSDDRRAAARPLARKRAAANEARALRAKALAELAGWLRDNVLAGRDQRRWSDVDLTGPNDPRRVIAIARARHLGGGKSLRALEVRISDAGGRVVAGRADSGHLDAPDALIESTRRKP